MPKCGIKSITFTVIFIILFIGLLYVLLGNLNGHGKPISIHAIFQGIAISSDPVAPSSNSNPNKNTETTQKAPMTTTVSEHAKLMFRKEYERINNNLQNGFQADTVLMQNYEGHSDRAFKHLGASSLQTLSDILRNSAIAENAENSALILPHDRLRNVNAIHHPVIPKLRVKHLDQAGQYNLHDGPSFVAPGGPMAAAAKSGIQPVFEYAGDQNQDFQNQNVDLHVFDEHNKKKVYR